MEGFIKIALGAALGTALVTTIDAADGTSLETAFITSLEEALAGF